MQDCCSTGATPKTESTSVGFRPDCPHCLKSGKAVSLLTLKHQVKSKHLAAVESGPFAFCRSPVCPVVYFNTNGTTLTLADIRQMPTAKTNENPQLCYCFGFDTDMVRAEVRASGECTISSRIAAEMKAGRCRCEIRNPQGACCFSNVVAAIKRELAVPRPNGRST